MCRVGNVEGTQHWFTNLARKAKLLIQLDCQASSDLYLWSVSLIMPRGSRSPAKPTQDAQPQRRPSQAASARSRLCNPANTQCMEPIEDEEIYIDEALISGSDSDGDEPPRVRTHRQTHGTENDEDTIQSSVAASDPLCSPEEQEKIPTTADIRHFFERTSEDTVCRYCK